MACARWGIQYNVCGQEGTRETAKESPCPRQRTTLNDNPKRGYSPVSPAPAYEAYLLDQIQKGD